jgi:hypothetical protein
LKLVQNARAPRLHGSGSNWTGGTHRGDHLGLDDASTVGPPAPACWIPVYQEPTEYKEKRYTNLSAYRPICTINLLVKTGLVPHPPHLFTNPTHFSGALSFPEYLGLSHVTKPSRFPKPSAMNLLFSYYARFASQEIGVNGSTWGSCSRPSASER